MIDNQRRLYAFEEDDNREIVKAEPIEMGVIEHQEYSIADFLPKTENFVEPWIVDQTLLAAKPEEDAKSEPSGNLKAAQEDVGDLSSAESQDSSPKFRKRKTKSNVSYLTKRKNKNYSVDQMNQAVEAVNSWKMSVLDAAIHFQVPQATIRTKMNRKPPVVEEKDINLDEKQEVQVRNFIKNRNESGIQTSNEDIINCASRVLWRKKKIHSPEVQALWMNWTDDFRNRHASYSEAQIDDGFTHTCDMCNFTALRKKDLRSHMKFHLDPKRQCLKTYKQSDLEKAVRLINKGTITINGAVNRFNIPRSTLTMKLNNEKIPKRRRAESDEVHKCSYCDKVFYNLGNLKSHIRKHLEPEGEFTCEECGKVYLTMTRLKLHKVFHKRGVFKCNRCDMVFDLKKDVELHRLVHLPLLPCEVCGKMVTKGAVFTAHMRKHGEPQYKCPIDGCPKQYFEKKSLNLHVTHFHAPDQNLSCQKCGKLFPNPLRLQRHERVHMEKLFLCQVDGCKHRSKRKEHMRLHLRNHKNIDVKLRDELIANIRINKHDN